MGSVACAPMRRAAVFVATVLLLVACGDADDEVSTDADVVELRFRTKGELSDAAADRLEEIILNRLAALGVEDASAEVSGDILRLELPTAASSEAGDLAGVIGRTAELRFRPVLLQVPLSAEDEPPMEVTPPDDDGADETVVLDDPSEARFQLGPVEATGTIIEDADAQLSPSGEWQIALSMTSDGIDAFNAMASRCSPPSETCPTGQVAIVLDSEVLSAPTIQAPSFERDDIVIAGTFTEPEAKELAVALRYGSLPTSLELIQDG